MARTRGEAEGEVLVQHPEISSTSDSYYSPLHPSNSFPKCRSSYRRRVLRSNHSSITFLNPRSYSLDIMQNPSVTVSNLSKTLLIFLTPINSVSVEKMVMQRIIFVLGPISQTDSVLTTRFATVTVVLIFICSLCSLVIVYASFPNLTE